MQVSSASSPVPQFGGFFSRRSGKTEKQGQQEPQQGDKVQFDRDALATAAAAYGGGPFSHSSMNAYVDNSGADTLRRLLDERGKAKGQD